MDRSTFDEGERETEQKRSAEGLPADINSHRSGLAEQDAVQSQADVLSPDGVRIGDDLPAAQKDAIRRDSR